MPKRDALYENTCIVLVYFCVPSYTLFPYVLEYCKVAGLSHLEDISSALKNRYFVTKLIRIISFSRHHNEDTV